VNQFLKTFNVEPARSIPPKRRFASLLIVSEARAVFPVCTVEKVFPPTYTIAGVKISWRQVRSVFAGDTSREASSADLLDLKKENGNLKQLVAEIALKNRVPKKSLNGSDFEVIDL
jgi:hypothetical protein